MSEAADLLAEFGIDRALLLGGPLIARSPIDGVETAGLPDAGAAGAQAAIARAAAAFLPWRDAPAPRRGELVRLLGEELRAAKPALGRLVTLEAGKIVQEGLGEVQEMIDVCDFAVGLSRQLHGLTIATERPGHAMRETWHPLGPVGVITAFNFPVAVWAWNAAVALVCGDPVVWKPSEKTPLTALAVMALFRRAAARFGGVPEGLAELVIGGAEAGAALVDDPRLKLVSATGSTRMGRAIAPRLAARFARALLELGGNNAMIVCPSADRDLAVRAIVFRRWHRRPALHQPAPAVRPCRLYDALVPRLGAPRVGARGRPARARHPGRPADRCSRLRERCRPRSRGPRPGRRGAWWRTGARRGLPGRLLRPPRPRRDAGANRRS